MYPSATSGQAFYNARYYDSALGRFIQADTIVPSPANPQSFNRYAYTLNNPLRYTDPSGHFTKDEIMASLIDQYGQEEAERIWDIWLTGDPGFMWALYEAKHGWRIWASSLNGFGMFEVNKAGRITVHWCADVNGEPYVTDVELYRLQGQGGYQLSSPENRVPFMPAYDGRLSQQILLDYTDDGRPGKLKGFQYISWVGTFKPLVSLYGREAPWQPDKPEFIMNVLGMLPIIGDVIDVVSFLSIGLAVSYSNRKFVRPDTGELWTLPPSEWTEGLNLDPAGYYPPAQQVR